MKIKSILENPFSHKKEKRKKGFSIQIQVHSKNIFIDEIFYLWVKLISDRVIGINMPQMCFHGKRTFTTKSLPLR